MSKRRVLVLAYYFPPMGLSGVQRTLKFASYLPQFGWQPTVLTCEPHGYFAYDESLMDEAKASGIEIIRAPSWDPTRLFRRRETVQLPSESRRQVLSKVSQFLFVPDNKVGWWLPARKRALMQHERTPFDLIFSSAPPYTAHLVAGGLARTLGLPLVLDFRDDWLGNPRHRYPTALHEAATTYLERRALGRSARNIVINDVIRRNLFARNAEIVRQEDVVVVQQGYDPQDFDAARDAIEHEAHGSSKKFTLLYSGVFYDVQTPEPFLEALADTVTRRADLKSRIEAVFVGLLPDSALRLAEELGIRDIVRHIGYVPHAEAVKHLLRADALWMMVGRTEGAESISTSKLFEYFGARKPILGLVPDGAAKDALVQYGAAEIADPDVIAEISAAIERLYGAWNENRLPDPSDAFVQQFDRRRLTRKLAALFDGVIRERGEAPAAADRTNDEHAPGNRVSSAPYSDAQ